MRKLGVKWINVLVIAGLWILMPELMVGQQTSSTSTTQSEELAEAERLNQQVDQLYTQGKYREAIPLAERVLAIRKTVLKEPNLYVVESLNNLGLLYYIQGRCNEVEPLYMESLAIVKRLQGEESSDVASILNNLAGLYQCQGRYIKAEQLFIQSLEMTKRLLGEEHPDVATSLNNFGGFYETIGRLNEAENRYNQAWLMRKRLLGEEHPDVATSLNNLGGIYFLQGRYREAENFYNQAWLMRKRLLGEEHPDVATSLNNLAELYKYQGRFNEAENRYCQSLKIQAPAANSSPEVARHENLYCQSLDIQKLRLGERNLDVARSLSNLAEFYREQGLYIKAEPLYIEALNIREEVLGKQHLDVSSSLNNLALLYVAQERYPKAESLYKQTLEIQKNLLKEHPNIAVSINNLAELYKITKRYRDAEVLYLQAIEMQKRVLGEKHPDLSTSFNNLAALYESEGDISKAIKFLLQGANVQEQNLNYNLATGFERQKRDYVATISGTTYATVSLHLNSAPNNPKASHLAFTIILQRKGRILDILTNNFQILRQRVNDPKNQKLIDELSSSYSQFASLIYNKPSQILPEQYRQQVEYLENKAKEKEDELSRRSAEFRLQGQAANVETIQKLIPSGAALVELVRYRPFNPKAPEKNRFGEPRYAAYVLNPSGEPQGIDLGEAKKIEEALDSLRLRLGDSNADPTIDINPPARNLDKIVMQPIRKLLGNTRKILISPDGALNLIPFEALIDENNQYLLENYSFTYLTSGRDLLRLQNTFPSKQPPVVMADPYFDRAAEVTSILNQTHLPPQTRSIDLSQGNFPPLAKTAQEAEAISSLLGIKPLIGSQASKGNLQQLKSPKVLHIATHGFFESSQQEDKNTFEDNPLLLSGLVLAGLKNHQVGSNDNGILTALETTSLNLLGTKLVVLSACDTGVGKDTTGEGVYGLRRALVIAGSESQIISLWKVDDNATKDLMVDYYKGVLANQGRSEALRQTQLKMLRGELGKDYQHPYYWAAFIPSGDWRPMEY